MSKLPSQCSSHEAGEGWWLNLTVNLVRSRTTGEMGFCEDYFHQVNLVGKTCPLWVALFPRLASWNSIKRRK